MDIDWRPNGLHAGVEVKVSDVLDSLFDVLKLATAIDHGLFDEGFCVTAANASQWTHGSVYSALSEARNSNWIEWDVSELLLTAAARAAVLVARGPRPYEVPERIETFAAAPILMPNAPTHALRILAVRPALGAGSLTLPA